MRSPASAKDSIEVTSSQRARVRVVAYSLDSMIQFANLWVFRYKYVEHAHTASGL